jgi:hypothetical protein
MLLAAGANCLRNKWGNTALYYAITFSSHESLKLIINLGNYSKALHFEQLRRILNPTLYVDCSTLQLLIPAKLEINGSSTEEWKSLEIIAYEQLAACKSLSRRRIDLWKQFLRALTERAGYQP